MSANDFAFRTDALHGSSYFHDLALVSVSQSVDNATASEIVRRQLDQNAISRKDTDEMFPHLAGYVGQYFVPIFQLDPEHRVGKRLANYCFNFYRVFLGQISVLVALRCGCIQPT
jgi:hypothetical protein